MTLTLHLGVAVGKTVRAWCVGGGVDALAVGYQNRDRERKDFKDEAQAWAWAEAQASEYVKGAPCAVTVRRGNGKAA